MTSELKTANEIKNAVGELKLKSDPKYIISIGCKMPSRIQFAMADANVTIAYDDIDDFSASLDDAVEKLDEALSAALMVVENKHSKVFDTV